MSNMDVCLARHQEIWHGVARYSVYRNDKLPQGEPAGVNTVVKTGLGYETAKTMVAELSEPYRDQSGWLRPLFGIKLENQSAALHAVREADVWAGLTAQAQA